MLAIRGRDINVWKIVDYNMISEAPKVVIRGVHR